MKKVVAKWKMKDGTKIRICDMGATHLLNTIALLERFAEGYRLKALRDAYSISSMLEGEMATFYMEQDIDRLESSTTCEILNRCCPIYFKLLKEKRE